jgi:hypothetical protein
LDVTEQTFDDLLDKLVSHYHCPQNRLLVTQLFRNREQKDNETVSEYALDLKRLIRTCDFGANLEDNLVERFVTGLK